MVKSNAVLEVKKDDSQIAIDVVSLDEAKEYIKVELDITEEDDLIEDLITTSVSQCEGYLNISIIPATVTTILNNSLGGIELPYGPIESFSSLKDCDDNELTADEGYKLQGIDFRTIKFPCYAYLKAEYTTGYTELPQHFKTAVLQQVAYLYENRGDTSIKGLGPTALQTLKPYRRVW